MLAPMHLLYLFGAGFRMALSSVRNNDLLSSQLARTGMAKKTKNHKPKKTQSLETHANVLQLQQPASAQHTSGRAF